MNKKILALFLSLFFSIPQSLWALAPKSKTIILLPVDHKAIEKILGEIAVKDLRKIRGNYRYCPSPSSPVIVLTQGVEPSPPIDQFKRALNAPLLKIGSISINGRNYFYEVYPSEDELLLLRGQPHFHLLVLQHLLASFNLNPEWVPPFFRVRLSEVKEELKRLIDPFDYHPSPANRLKMEETLKNTKELERLARETEEGNQTDIYTFIVGYLNNEETFDEFVHELLHASFFSDFIGEERRKEFEKIILDPEVEEYIRVIFQTRWVDIEKRFSVLKDEREPVIKKRIILSEFFSRFFAIYYFKYYGEASEKQLRNPEYLVKALKYALDAKILENPMPKKLKDFFEEIPFSFTVEEEPIILKQKKSRSVENSA